MLQPFLANRKKERKPEMQMLLIDLWRMLVFASLFPTFLAACRFVFHIPERLKRLFFHERINADVSSLDINEVEKRLILSKVFIKRRPLWVMPLLIVLSLVANLNISTHVFENDLRSRSYGTYCFTVKFTENGNTQYYPADVNVDFSSLFTQVLTIEKIYMQNNEFIPRDLYDVEIGEEYEVEWETDDRNEYGEVDSYHKADVTLLNKRNYSPYSQETKQNHPVFAIISTLALFELVLALFELREHKYALFRCQNAYDYLVSKERKQNPHEWRGLQNV